MKLVHGTVDGSPDAAAAAVWKQTTSKTFYIT